MCEQNKAKEAEYRQKAMEHDISDMPEVGFQPVEFLKKAFNDMKESAKAQHEVDKANFAAVKAESKAQWEEAKAMGNPATRKAVLHFANRTQKQAEKRDKTGQHPKAWNSPESFVFQSFQAHGITSQHNMDQTIFCAPKRKAVGSNPAGRAIWPQTIGFAVFLFVNGKGEAGEKAYVLQPEVDGRKGRCLQ